MYRTELATGRVTQITNLFTGVAGITATSPALTVAQRSGRLMFSLFRSKGYDIYAVDAPSRLAGEPVVASLPGRPGIAAPGRSDLGAGEAAARRGARPASRRGRGGPPLQRRAVAHLRGAAVDRRGLERVRHLRRGWRGALLERPHGEPQPHHRPAGERRHPGRDRPGRLSELRQPLELGGVRAAGAVRNRRLCRGDRRGERGAGPHRAAGARPTDQP